jgi:predicted PurR-regulated permease PerM
MGTSGTGGPGDTAKIWYGCCMNSLSNRRVVRRSRGERRVTYALKILATIALAALMASAVIAFFGRIPSVAIILIGATFFTYAIYPVVRRLNASMPLLWAIVIVYVVILSLIAFLAAFVIPALVHDVQSLAAAMPALVQRAQRFFEDPTNPLIAHLPSSMRATLANLPPQIARFAQTYAGEAATRVLGILLSIVSIVATVVVIPVLSVYLMIEAPQLIDSFILRLPQGARSKTTDIVRDLDKALGGFIRGQLLVGATIGACITIALLILHVRYAVLIGVLAGLFDIIPYVGAIVGFVPSVLLALADDGWRHALVVAAVFIGIFQLEGHFIAPKIVSDSVGLSPLMVIVAILIGGELLGIGGMFLAVPVAAMIRVFALHAFPERGVLPEGAAGTPLADAAGVPGEADPRTPGAEKARGVRA